MFSRLPRLVNTLFRQPVRRFGFSAPWEDPEKWTTMAQLRALRKKWETENPEYAKSYNWYQPSYMEESNNWVNIPDTRTEYIEPWKEGLTGKESKEEVTRREMIFLNKLWKDKVMSQDYHDYLANNPHSQGNEYYGYPIESNVVTITFDEWKKKRDEVHRTGLRK